MPQIPTENSTTRNCHIQHRRFSETIPVTLVNRISTLPTNLLECLAFELFGCDNPKASVAELESTRSKFKDDVFLDRFPYLFMSPITQIPEASLFDNLKISVCHLLPYFLRGIFLRNRTLVWALTALRLHPFSARFGNTMRLKYGCDYLYFRMLGRRSLFVFGNDGLKHVLDNSPAVYAEANLKRTGMSHFQPRAVTVSRGQLWQDRRDFNTDVLESANAVHSQAADFLKSIEPSACTAHQTWDDFEASFEQIMTGVLFGETGESAAAISQTQKELMRDANRIISLKTSNSLGSLQGKIRDKLHTASKGLASQCPHARQTSSTKPVDQITHWMFALRDTVATNTARAMAIIASHPEPRRLVREEIKQCNLADPNAINQLHYLEGCIQEAMRLWPSTPLLVRETTQTDQLGKWTIPPNTQIVISNNFHHRDTSTFRDADRFVPLRWKDSPVNYKFNHFSNGNQACAGKNLALLITKSFIAMAMAKYDYDLVRPKLDPNVSIPYMFNHFKIRFSCSVNS